MHGYVASGAHRSAMPHLRDWAAEASVVRWMVDKPRSARLHRSSVPLG
ncbi:hypothetical protein [Rhizobium leguminosarum]|nr:hypothetical protein [Rhizobium leguminosarum]